MEDIDKVVELDLGCRPEAAVSGPLLLATDRSTFLTFNAVHKVGKWWEDAGHAVVELPHCVCVQFGYPNDEALPGHPLYAAGVQSYGIYEVLNSSCDQRLEKQNRVAFPHADYSGRRLRHFIIVFHDSTFECLAGDIRLELTREPFQQTFDRIAKRVLAE